jgi:hypothetical protein
MAGATAASQRRFANALAIAQPDVGPAIVLDGSCKFADRDTLVVGKGAFASASDQRNHGRSDAGPDGLGRCCINGRSCQSGPGANAPPLGIRQRNAERMPLPLACFDRLLSLPSLGRQCGAAIIGRRGRRREFGADDAALGYRAPVESRAAVV